MECVFFASAIVGLLKPTCNNRARSSSSDTTDQLHPKTRKIDDAPLCIEDDLLAQKLTPTDVGSLTGTESFFTSDDYLIPVIENDPVLRKRSFCPPSLLLYHSHLELDFDDDWSDEEGDGPSAEHGSDPPADLPSALRRIHILEKKLSQAQNDLSDYRRLVTQNLDISSIAEIINDPVPSTDEAPRDDDTHYFLSYEYNGMHPFVVIQSR